MTDADLDAMEGEEVVYLVVVRVGDKLSVASRLHGERAAYDELARHDVAWLVRETTTTRVTLIGVQR